MPLYSRPPDSVHYPGLETARESLARVPLSPEHDNLLVQYRVIDGIRKRDIIRLGLSLVRKLPAEVVKELVRQQNR